MSDGKYGDPSGPDRFRRVADVVIAVVVAAAVAGLLARLGTWSEQGPLFTVAVLVGLSTPMLVRRRWPGGVLVVVLLVSLGVGLVEPQTVGNLALLVALFTFSRTGPRRQVVGVAGLVVLLSAALSTRVPGADPYLASVFSTGLVLAAVGLGLHSASRRDYLVALQQRAERMELERDQQGALAAAAERARIAREMHDIVAHHLTVMVALSQGASAALPTHPEVAAEALASVTETGREALRDTRTLLGVLRDDLADGAAPALEPQSSAGLDALVAKVRAAGLPVTLTVSGGDPTAHPAVRLAVYRIVQESLTNTLKHGGAGAHCVVALTYTDDGVHISVTDDGPGPSSPTPDVAGRGLIGMRERALAVGGELVVGPGSPTGWQVRARLPRNGWTPG